MQVIDFTELQKLISIERLQPYLKMANSDRDKAANLYFQNLEKCQDLYIQFHWLEVILRNTISRQLAKNYGMSWYDNPKINFGIIELDKISRAKQVLSAEGKNIDSPNMVAAFTLGFWVSLFNGRYEDLWRHCLRYAFPKAQMALKRKDLSSRLHPLLKLRNRIAHYEPILKYDLRQSKQVIADILSWI